MPLAPLASLAIDAFAARSYSIWEHGWFLLTAGDFAAGHYNAMTVSWGALGCMWSKPIAQVVVRPHRYTFELIEAYPDFTLCAFSRDYRPALNLLGTKSGRDGDKIAAVRPDPAAASRWLPPFSPRPSWCSNAASSTGRISIRPTSSPPSLTEITRGRITTAFITARSSPSRDICLPGCRWVSADEEGDYVRIAG